MQRLIFITHPEVVVDPKVAVPRWHLTERGVARMRIFAATPVAANLSAIWASTETKAIEAAGILAAHHGIGIQVDADLGENDRSATGFLPPAEFEQIADQFFAAPETSVRGWERAIDAQQRIATAVARIIAATQGTGDIAVVAHGAVGTLLYAHFTDQPISRAMDQPFQGHYWAATLPDMAVAHGWRPIAER